MEKINRYEQEPDLIDELLAITDSTRRTLLALKRSKSVSKPTPSQLEMMSLLGIPGSTAATREKAQQLIDRKALQILTSIAEGLTVRGNTKSVKVRVQYNGIERFTGCKSTANLEIFRKSLTCFCGSLGK